MADDPTIPGTKPAAVPEAAKSIVPDPNATPGASDSDSAAAAPAAKGEPQAEPQRESRAQRRIQQLVAEKNYWKGRAEAPGSGGAQTTPPANVQPTRDQYATDVEYIDALTDWKLNNALPTVVQRITEAQTRQAAEQRFSERVTEVAKKYEDWDEVMDAADAVMLPTTHLEVIQQSEHAPEVVYRLGKDPALAQRISRMTPINAAREIGRIEAAIASQQKPGNGGGKSASAAPAPITPVPAGAAKAGKNPDDMSMAEYREWRKSMRKQT